MPRGRIRQTPTEAAWDSELRILEATAHGWVGFNEIQRATGRAPSAGPSAISRAATKLPRQLLAVLLEDMVRRQDIERPRKQRTPSIKRTKAMMRTFPRIWIFEIHWDVLATNLDADTTRAVWEQVRNALPSRGLVERV